MQNISNNIHQLYSVLLEMAEAQRKALQEGRLEEAVALYKRRQKIIDEIQNFDREGAGKNAPVREEFSGKVLGTIERILSIDAEMQTIIQAELNSISNRLGSIHKLRTFCHNTSFHREVARFDVIV